LKGNELEQSYLMPVMVMILLRIWAIGHLTQRVMSILRIWAIGHLTQRVMSKLTSLEIGLLLFILHKLFSNIIL
jgi:hypothetical protein